MEGPLLISVPRQQGPYIYVYSGVFEVCTIPYSERPGFKLCPPGSFESCDPPASFSLSPPDGAPARRRSPLKRKPVQGGQPPQLCLLTAAHSSRFVARLCAPLLPPCSTRFSQVHRPRQEKKIPGSRSHLPFSADDSQIEIKSERSQARTKRISAVPSPLPPLSLPKTPRDHRAR